MVSQSGHSAKGYEEKSFLKKVTKFAVKAGKEVIEKALTLYFCLNDPDTPPQAKMVIAGALVYFVNPMDAIADVVPLAGFADDLGAIASATAIVAIHIKPVHKTKAKERIKALFHQSIKGK